ncbi:MAG TPA: hypothetical protein VF834_03570 [Streptosporangiaceae bacterium]
MSGPVIAGLAVLGLVVVTLVVAVLFLLRDTPPARAKRARSFAKASGPWCPDERVDSVSRRVRRRSLFVIFWMAPVSAPLAFWLGYYWWQHLGHASRLFPGMWMYILLITPVGAGPSTAIFLLPPVLFLGMIVLNLATTGLKRYFLRDQPQVGWVPFGGI